MSTLSRRSLLVAGTAGVLGTVAGCGGSRPGTGGSGAAPSGVTASTGPSGTISVSPSVSPSAGLPVPKAWQPSSIDIQPAVKLRAVRLIEALGSWPEGGQGQGAARQRAAAAGYDPALAAQAAALLGPSPRAALQVLEAQYGGILSDSASVLVVCRQWTDDTGGYAGGAVAVGGTTVDVRLSRAQPQWRVTALQPAQPGPAVSGLSAPAHAVLASDAITLPPAALADVRSGNVHDSALEAMLTLARAHRIELSVVRSGHPIDVFGTSRPSDHPKGRAFDVWRIDGHAVVDPSTPHALVDGFMRAAAAAGSYNVGGPRQLSGGTGNQFFSDDTHHDHVHVGFAT
ncbi:hypothetical protein [Streptacidiphilus cavernicola]|uniref:Extensin-like C-terminal domain-containing protein n=1 Tax=Streptacidiphilus cavernicola TaxID=3342716 RepID=A0ABV6VVR4_9ACTN